MPAGALSAEDLQRLEACLPTGPELKTVMAYEGPEEALAPAEAFFRALASVPRPAAKVSALLFWRHFSSAAEVAGSRLDTLQKACEEATTSDRLARVLDWVLKIGNVLNEGECQIGSGSPGGGSFSGGMSQGGWGGGEGQPFLRNTRGSSLVDQSNPCDGGGMMSGNEPPSSRVCPLWVPARAA